MGYFPPWIAASSCCYRLSSEALSEKLTSPHADCNTHKTLTYLKQQKRPKLWVFPQHTGYHRTTMGNACASKIWGLDGTRMVRAVGLEPTLLAEPDFESGASTNFTTPARRRPIRPNL